MHEPPRPIGSLVAYAVPDHLPVGHLPCDGAEVSRHLYAALFDVIGERHGIGDGVSTFNVPDLSGSPLRWLIYHGGTR